VRVEAASAMTLEDPVKPTWRRRLLNVANKLGLKTIDVDSGVSVVMRSDQRESRVVRLEEGVFVVATGTAAKHVSQSKLDDGSWSVTTTRAKKQKKKSKKAPDIGGPDWDALSELKPHLGAEKRILREMGSKHVAWTLERFEVDVVLDVGGNIGQYGKSLRAEGYTGHIVSFEPVPQFFEKLQNAASGDDAWTVHQMGLGAEDGSLPMRVQRSLSSMLDNTDFGRQRFKSMREFGDDEPIEVPVYRLDSVLDDVLAPLREKGIENPRIYLKMDTQGFDLEVFAGLGERTQDIVAMQSEVALLLIYQQMPRMPEAVAAYEEAGFEISGLYPITRQPDGRVIEYDCILVRAEELPER